MPELEPDGLEEEDTSITVEVSWRRFAPRHDELIDARRRLDPLISGFAEVLALLVP